MDNRNNIGSPDRDCINIHENYEAEYRTKTLGINADELRKPIEAAGTSADAARKYIKK